MRAWVEAMEDQRYAEAYRSGIELLIVGLPLADTLDLSELNFGLDEWREMHAEELLHSLVGFVAAVSTVAARDDAAKAPLLFPTAVAGATPVQPYRVSDPDDSTVHSEGSCEMDEKTAEHLAAIVGGESWQSGGGIYLVTVNRDDGSLVVFSGDAIAEYENDEAFDAGRASKLIPLTIPEGDDLYVLVDLQGNVFYCDDAMERGWRHQEDAEREARGLESRGEGHFSVVRQGDLPA